LYPFCISLYFLSWISYRSFCISLRSFATGATSASFESLCILPRSLCNLQGSPRILLYLLPISHILLQDFLRPSGISKFPYFPDLMHFAGFFRNLPALAPDLHIFSTNLPQLLPDFSISSPDLFVTCIDLPESYCIFSRSHHTSPESP
jgi:hypothetical protein